MTIGKILWNGAGVVATALFLYPIFKMTATALKSGVDLYPILMVLTATIIAYIFSMKKI